MTSRRLNLSVQYVCSNVQLPSRPQIRLWARAALNIDGMRGGQVTVRFVDAEEGQSLNNEFRGKDHATNVLSFPYETEPVVCGDLVICTPVVEREAQEQRKSLDAHIAHLIIHGMLHLQGYDHETSKADARRMENHERAILLELGYTDPYSVNA